MITERDELGARLRNGDESAFDEIFRTWYAPLVRVAEGVVGSRAIAEEIVQDVMLELWRRRESLAPGSAPQAYLFQSVRNRALNEIRHDKVRKRGEPHIVGEASVGASAQAHLVEEEIEVALRGGVAALPERTRAIFEMSRVQGLKYSEIAAMLGISIKTVEAQMGRALRILRERLAPWLPVDGGAGRGR